MKSRDYLNGDMVVLSKKSYEEPEKEMNQKEAKALIDKMMKDAQAFESADSRVNEIIRVCTAIRAFAEVGMNSDHIDMRLGSFQNG